MQPNRLEKVWGRLEPEILKKWEKLVPNDLAACQFKYDLIIEAIRKAYYPGRSHLSLEADIRDWINAQVAFHERSS